MEFEHITDYRQLREFCERARTAEQIAFDTEFVSEHRYRPQLCLLQIATPEALAIVDTIAINDITPFWELICEHVPTTVVHAAREEFLFCLRDYGKRPRHLVDLQIVGAFIGFEYPASYGTIVQKVLGRQLPKGETRTDWRQRPLAKKQIHYALQDVEFLLPLQKAFDQELSRLDRHEWYREEIDSWQTALERIESEPQWERLPGLNRLNRRELGIARELFIWREAAAQSRERTPRRVLPDDLLIEIAKRGDSQLSRLTAIRGLTQRINARLLPEISEVVESALALPDSKLPPKRPHQPSVSIGILGQFLTTSLNLVCQEKQIAPGLVANAQEIRNLAAMKMGEPCEENTESLLEGWRGPLLDELFDRVLSGRVALRVSNPKSANPVKLEEWPS